MRYLRKFVQRIGLVSTLLIGGVLGGLLTPLPSEALTVSLDGQGLTLTTYTCETGFTSCAYLTSTATTTQSKGGWTVSNVSATNRARVRINDVGGTPATNVDKVNLTGMILTPPANNTAGKTTHIIITHTFANGQGVGNYTWGMGATGYFDPAGTDTVINNKFVLNGRGRFSSSEAELSIGKLDKGSFKSPQAGGANGIVTQTVPVATVKIGCNTDNIGACKPTITYDFEVTVVGQDVLVLTDSVIGGGIKCTDAELDPVIPNFLLFLMRLVDPLPAVLPTHISGLNAWIDQMAVKYNLNPTQLAKLEKFKTALFKWLASQTCTGKVTTLLTQDATSGTNQGRAAGGTLVTTCVDTNTCGTITITKNTRNALGSPLQTSDTFTFNVTGPSLLNEMISMGGQDSQSKTVTVESGTYNITEGELSEWTLNSSSCGLEGPTMNVFVPVGENVSCTFNNNRDFSSDDYRVIYDPGLTWDAARTAAQGQVGGAGVWDLASITSAEEQAFIETLLPDLNVIGTTTIHDYWIGGIQFGESEPGGDWRWDRENVQFYDGGAIPGVYSNWGTGEPNNVGGAENHLTVDNRFMWSWNDLTANGSTGFPKGYIAKRYPSPVD